MKHSCTNAICLITVVVSSSSLVVSCSDAQSDSPSSGRRNSGGTSPGGNAGSSGVGGVGGGTGGSAAGAGGTAGGSAGISGSGGALGNSGSGGNAGSAGSGGNSGGSAGSAGSAGMNGASGTAGRGGTNGASGAAGTNGASGSAGTAGTGGTSGTGGSAGSAGRGGTSGTAGTNGASGTGGGPGCASGQSDCGGVCVNTTNDPAHCGRCNNPCPSGSCANSSCTPVTASGLIGWASVNGRGLATTTGGQGGSTVDVNSASALQSAAESSTRQIIRISGTLSVSELNVNSNKTLIGVGTNATINGGININGKSNIIIQNLRVNGKTSGAGGDAIHIENSHHVWIDHCDVWDAPDGNLDISNRSDLITVSWTRFWYSSSPGDNAHRFSNLIGSDDAAPDAGYLNVTFHHNWWAERVIERMPRVRYGKVHIFNNYFSSSGNNYCVRAGVEADVRIENNHFENVQNPYEIDSDNGTAVVTAAGNTFSGGGGSRQTRGTAFTPPYQFQLQAASGIRDAVRAGWGPR